MGVSITIIFVHPKHTIGPSAVSSSIFTRVALEPAIWATCPHAEVKTAEDSDHESLQSQDVDDHIPRQNVHCSWTLKTMKNESFTPPIYIYIIHIYIIWVITPKNGFPW